MIKKNVENSGGTVRLGYSFNCSSTPKPTIDWDYTQTDGFHVTIGDSEITVVVDENDTGSNSRTLVITPYIDGDPCKDNRIQISQGAGDEPGECSYEVTAAKTVINCEDDHVVRFTFKKTDSGKGGGDIKFYLNGSTSPSTETTVDCNTESISLKAEVPSGPSGDVGEILHNAAARYCNNTGTQAGFESSYTKHQPTTANGSKHITIKIKNTGTTYLAYNGNFVINDGSTDYLACYREPSSTENGKHWYYCEGNKILAPQEVITIEVPLERTIGNTTQNIGGKALSSFKFYTAVVGSDGYMSNRAVYLSNGGSITKVSGPDTVVDGETYQLNISVANTNNYLFSSEDLTNGYHVHDDIVVPTDLDGY